MNTARTISTSALVAALALTLVGCNQSSEDARKATTVETERSLNTEICNAAAWIRERAPAGLCSGTSVVDDNMSLRRLHEELERSER
jgi:hypothetical protein